MVAGEGVFGEFTAVPVARFAWGLRSEEVLFPISARAAPRFRAEGGLSDAALLVGEGEGKGHGWERASIRTACKVAYAYTRIMSLRVKFRRRAGGAASLLSLVQTGKHLSVARGPSRTTRPPRPFPHFCKAPEKRLYQYNSKHVPYPRIRAYQYTAL